MGGSKNHGVLLYLKFFSMFWQEPGRILCEIYYFSLCDQNLLRFVSENYWKMETTQMLACTQALDTSLEHEEATHKRLVSPTFFKVQEKKDLDFTSQSRRVHHSEPKPWRYVENVTYGTYLVVDVK